MTGLIYVVFGEQFDHMAAHTIAYSRKFTNLPITVLSNLQPGHRSPKWKEIEGIDFLVMDLPTEENREIKTTIINHTPYENTLYLDADSIIQNESFDSEVEKYFRGDFDLLINWFCQFPTQDNRFQNIYLRAYNQFGCSGTMNVYNGAIIGFKKTDKAKELFTKWNEYWKDFGKQREMPPFASAILTTEGLMVNEFVQGFFSPDVYLDTAVVQHNSNDDNFFGKIRIPFMETPVTSHRVDDYSFTQL